MSDLKKITLTFAANSLKSDIQPVPAANNENGALAAVQVDLHSNFPTATAVELRHANTNVPDAALARYNESGTLISFAGAASRQVSLEPARNCAVKGFAQLVSDTTIVTGGLCTVYYRDV